MVELKRYTTQLQAGLGLIEETKTLLDLWQPGMDSKELNRVALDSGSFSNVSARRLRNITAECFAPRYLVDEDYPAFLLKQVLVICSASELRQLLFLYTARANTILYDFVYQQYWQMYGAGSASVSNGDALAFVVAANQDGHTVRQWSEITIKRVSSYLTGSCADFGLLETGRRKVRAITPQRIEDKTILFLAYDLHFNGSGDNTIVNHPDWQLYGLQPSDVRADLKRLSKKGFFIIQTAGDSIHIGWQYKTWKELLDAITAS